jgi:hypothetical protein
MNPIIAIGDLHGQTYWKEVVKDNPNCRYVFLGDYLDPYENTDSKALVNNLKNIIGLKKERPQEVVLLLGNHDLHYFTSDIDRGERFNFRIAEEVATLFLENIHLFAYAHQEDKLLFTHAGVAHKWFVNDFKGDLHKNIADQLNNPTEEQVKPLCQCGFYRGGEKHVIGGIFWADTRELHEPLQGYTQIVGHNRVDDIVEHTHNGGKIIFCDCLSNKRYLKI